MGALGVTVVPSCKSVLLVSLVPYMGIQVGGGAVTAAFSSLSPFERQPHPCFRGTCFAMWVAGQGAEREEEEVVVVRRTRTLYACRVHMMTKAWAAKL